MSLTIWPQGAGGGGGWNGPGFPSITITQAFAAGSAIYFNGANWQLADASAANSLGIAIVASSSPFPSQSTIVFSGDVTGLPPQMPIEQGGILVPGPLTAGQYYFVSAAIPGALTLTEPATYSNPILFALSQTEAVVLPYRPSVTTSGGGWTTGYQIDFAALPNQGLVNGANTIDGKPWLVEKAGNAASMDVVSGAGIVITASPSLTSDIYNGSRNAAMLSAKLTDLAPVLSWPNSALRVWLHIGLTNVTNYIQGLLVILEQYAGNPAEYNVGTFYGNHVSNPGNTIFLPRKTINNATTQSAGVLAGALDTVVLVWHKPWTCSILGGTYAAGWPDPNTLIQLAWVDQSNGTIDPSYGLTSTQSLAVAFALANVAPVGGALGNEQAILKKMKVELK